MGRLGRRVCIRIGSGRLRLHAWPSQDWHPGVALCSRRWQGSEAECRDETFNCSSPVLSLIETLCWELPFWTAIVVHGPIPVHPAALILSPSRGWRSASTYLPTRNECQGRPVVDDVLSSAPRPLMVGGLEALNLEPGLPIGAAAVLFLRTVNVKPAVIATLHSNRRWKSRDLSHALPAPMAARPVQW